MQSIWKKHKSEQFCISIYIFWFDNFYTVGLYKKNCVILISGKLDTKDINVRN